MVKFAIVGCGYVAQRHAKHITAHPEAQLIGGYDIVPQKSKALAEEHDVVAFDSLEDLLASKDIDIVNVCTPNGDHHLSTIKALEANKHVLVEKPMAIKKSYAEDMIQTSLDKNKQLFVVKQNRFNPPIQKLKAMMQEQKIGEVYAVAVNCFWNRNEQYYKSSDWKGSKALDGGTLFTQFSHFIDIIYYLFGDLKILHAVTRNVNHQGLIEFEDTGIVTFIIKKNGAPGSLSYTTACYKQNMEGSITLFADNATIKVGGKYLNTVDYQVTDGFDIVDLPKSNPANDYGYYQGSMSNHDKIIHNVVASLQGREAIMTNAYEGLKVVEIIENIYDAVKSYD